MSTEQAISTGAWLLQLHPEARAWVVRGTPEGSTVRTPVYVDLTFAFGLAALGEREPARELLTGGFNALVNGDEAHHALRMAYRYRVEQALAGEPLAGPLPGDQVEYLEGMDRWLRYVVDRLRQS